MVFIRLYTLMAVLLFVPEAYGQNNPFEEPGEYRKYGEDIWRDAIITLDTRGKMTIRSVFTNEVITVTESKQSKNKTNLREFGVRSGQALIGFSTLYAAYGVRESWSEREFQYLEISLGVVGHVIGLFLTGLKPESQEDLAEQATKMSFNLLKTLSADAFRQRNEIEKTGSTFVPVEIRFNDEKLRTKFKEQLEKLRKKSTSSKPPNRMHFGLAPMRDGIKAGLSYTF